jgi:putative membrane protein
MLGFLLRAAIAAMGLWIATAWVPGVSIDGPRTLVLAGILLGVVNAIVRPIAIVLTFPVTIVSLGLFLLVINAGMVALVAWMLPGMHVAGFWSAFWSAAIVSLVGMLGAALIGPKGKVDIIVKRR